MKSKGLIVLNKLYSSKVICLASSLTSKKQLVTMATNKNLNLPIKVQLIEKLLLLKLSEEKFFGKIGGGKFSDFSLFSGMLGVS